MSVDRVNKLVDEIRQKLIPSGDVTLFDLYATMFDPRVVSALAEMAGAAMTPLPGTLYLAVAARGMPFGFEMARRHDGECAPVLKSAALPADRLLSTTRDSEYSSERVVIPRGCLPNDGVRRPVWIVDDVVATGGTVRAITALLRESYPHLEVQGALCLVRFTDKCPPDLDVVSFFDYRSDGTFERVGRAYQSPMVVQRTVHGLNVSNETTRMDSDGKMHFGSSNHVHFYPPTFGYPCMCDKFGIMMPSKRFPNGVPDWKIDVPVDGKRIRVYVDCQDRANMLDVVAFARVLARHPIESLKIVIPYFPDGTMERVETYGTIASAETVAHMIGDMPVTRSGPVTVTVKDLHALPNQFYFGEKVLVNMQTSVLVTSQYDVVVFPDDGAMKRYRSVCGGSRMMCFAKNRHGDDRQVTLQTEIGVPPPDWSYAAGTFVVVDDMMRTGGTILETMENLQKLGAAPRSVDVIVPNIDTQGSALLRFFHRAPPCFNKLIFTAHTRDGIALSRSGFFGDRVAPRYNDHALAASNRAVASTNKTKIDAYRAEFSVNVPSGVPPQPFDDLTARGARCRVESAKVAMEKFVLPNALYAFESGCVDGKEAVAYCCFKGEQTKETLLVTDLVHPHDCLNPDDPYTTTGQRMQRKYNLPSADAWVPNRWVMLHNAMNK